MKCFDIQVVNRESTFNKTLGTRHQTNVPSMLSNPFIKLTLIQSNKLYGDAFYVSFFISVFRINKIQYLSTRKKQAIMN